MNFETVSIHFLRDVFATVVVVAQASSWRTSEDLRAPTAIKFCPFLTQS